MPRKNTTKLPRETAVELAQVIRARRKILNLNQRQFGKLIGVSQQTVSSWETGAKLEVVVRAWTLADVLSAPVRKHRGK